MAPEVEHSEREHAGREQTGREDSERERTGREQTGREQTGRDRSGREPCEAERRLRADVPADLAGADPDDEFAPMRGLAIGLVMGTSSLSAMAALLWWAFA